jgi:uncharacterized protein YndB with AHSA1/START domain
MTYSSHHHTFTIEREIAASPSLAFFVWSNEDAKSAWFAGPPGWTMLDHHFDFREGGSERLKGRHPSGMISDFQCQYHDIVPDKRIIYTYDMYVGEKKISVSLATIEFTPNEAGTHLTVTEQITHIDGYPTPEDREAGTRHLIDKVVSYIESLSAKA